MWHAYRLVYRLESPLHVGWRKVGNLMQTRAYITGRNWWGAATAHLTQWQGGYSYRRTGAFVKANLIFGYFFAATDLANPLTPDWAGSILHYGSLHRQTADEFENRFINSIASSAIAYQDNTAATGQLHEVEFIVPRTPEGEDVFFIGHLFVRQTSRIECSPTEVRVDGLPVLNQVLIKPRIGGERRYGFGQLRLVADRVTQCDNLFGHTLDTGGERLLVGVNPEKPLPAHCIASGLDATGTVEPLLGREWDDTTGPGRRLSPVSICWTPGSKVQASGIAQIKAVGVWEMT